MKKVIALLLAALTLFSLAACGSKKADDVKTDVTPAEIEAAIAKALGNGDLATEDVPENEMFSCALSYLDLTKVKSYVAKQALVTAVNPDAVVIVECEDGYAEEAVKAFNESNAQTVKYCRLYSFNVAKAEGARLYRVGNTVMLLRVGAVYDGEDSEGAAKLAASEYQKVDDALKELLGSLPENLIELPEK